MPVSPEQIEYALRAATDAPPSSDFDLVKHLRPKGVTLRPAAVLMPLQDLGNGLRVILTRRSAALKHHPGQIAFPGGKVDADDPDPRAAALREAEEEIALPRNAVRVLGALPLHQTVTNFQVTPIVGLVNGAFEAKPEQGEVAEIFTVPLAHILNPKNYRKEWRVYQGDQRQFYTIPYGPFYVWGATARMLRIFADIMGTTDAD